jgi:Uma2 family endonuclease
MATITPIAPSAASDLKTVADLLEELGGIPASRVRIFPSPGKATEQDLLDLLDHQDTICELVDGTLVEKTMGCVESLLALAIAHRLINFVKNGRLGIVLGADGTLRVLPDQVRIPDVCFISWKRFPGGKLPDVQIPSVAPDLAIEILSPGNSEGEMRRKLNDYFAAGVALVWYIDPAKKNAAVYTSPDQCTVLDEAQILTGGAVLPGFNLALRDLFAEVEGRMDQSQ